MASSASSPPSIRLILLGDSVVGKSSILSQFENQFFSIDYLTTIGVGYRNVIRQVDEQDIRLEIFDTSGHYRFLSPNIPFHKHLCAGVMVVYDVGDDKSFNNIKEWIMFFKNRSEADAEMEIMILGNKCDVDDNFRMVSTDRGKLLAEECGAMFMEVSAKTGENINHAFTTLAQSILKHQKAAAVV